MKNNTGLQSKTTEELIINIQNRMIGHIDVMRETINTETPKIIKAGLKIAKTFEKNIDFILLAMVVVLQTHNTWQQNLSEDIKKIGSPFCTIIKYRYIYTYMYFK